MICMSSAIGMVFMDWLLLTGSLYPTSMRISEEGRLVVNFKTEARFHGLFVMSHLGKLNLQFSSSVKIQTHLPNFIFFILNLAADIWCFYVLYLSR